MKQRLTRLPDHPDLAVANSSSDNVSVLINNGDGTFAAAVNYGAGVYVFSVAMGDLDGDSHPDLAVANWNSDNVSVLINRSTPPCVLPPTADADYYQLCILNQYEQPIFYRWYATANVDNGDDTCTLNPGKILAPGNYYWLVTAKNQYGIGPASAKMAFTVAP